MNIVGLVLIVGAYFVGNLDFAYIIVKSVRNEDIRNYGSGNAGTTNVLRTMGSKYALLVFILDALKGSLVIGVTNYLVFTHGLNPYYIAATGIAVVAGHNWPACLGFRGGKGTATSIGVYMVVHWEFCLICLAIGIIILIVFKMVSLTSILGISVSMILILLTTGFIITPELVLSFFLTVSTIYQHRENIKRILSGTESKIGQKIKMDNKK